MAGESCRRNAALEPGLKAARTGTAWRAESDPAEPGDIGGAATAWLRMRPGKELVLSVNECPNVAKEQKMELPPGSDLFSICILLQNLQRFSKVAGCAQSEETERACPGELGEHEGHGISFLFSCPTGLRAAMA